MEKRKLQELQKLSVITELWFLFNEKYLLKFVDNFFKNINEGQTFVLHNSDGTSRKMNLLKLCIFNEPKPEYHIFLFKNEYGKYEIFVQKYVDNQMVEWYHEKIKCKEEYCKCNNILVSVDKIFMKIHMDKEALFSDKLIYAENNFDCNNCYMTRLIE